MKSAFHAALAVVLLAGASTALGRDDRLMFSVKSAVEKGQGAKKTLDPGIALYFGRQKTPPVAKRMGEWTANKKTNAENKTDQEACDIAFVGAALGLQRHARQEGGNAVINIHSVYRKDDIESATEYLCGAGTVMAGVALRGTVVTIKKK